MTLCEVGDKVVHLLWLHIFKYVNLLKNKSLFFYAQTFQRQQGIQVSTSYKKKKSTEDYRFRGSSLPWNFFLKDSKRSSQMVTVICTEKRYSERQGTVCEL